MQTIKEHSTLSIVYEDENSDTLSTGAPSLSPPSLHGSSFGHLSDIYYDQDSLDPQSRKIRKKRNAYQKIDDDLRLLLLEAVQQNGETLKSAAKRLNINYSSAKSILHTYRKEGRILKKTALERTLQICSFDSGELEMNPIQFPTQYLNENYNPKKNNMWEGLRPLEFQQCSTMNVVNENRPPSPMRGLSDNLSHLFLNHPLLEENSMPKPQIPDFSFRPRNVRIPLGEISPSQLNSTNSASSSQSTLSTSQSTQNPIETHKHPDGFYMNYSNSPLSGGTGMFKECSDSGSRTNYQKEFDSFTDMVSAFQSQKAGNFDEMKEEYHIPRFMRLNSAQLLQNKLEGMRESTPIEPCKGSVRPDWLMGESLKKTSCFSNLIYSQKPEISPTNNL